MKAFVTGATGFIGRRFVDKLLQLDYKVTALVRREDHGLPENVTIVNGDICNLDSYIDCDVSFDYVFHLAALISFDHNDTQKLIDINADASTKVFTAAKRWNAKTIFMSSASTIGFASSKSSLLDETANYDTNLTSNNPYMASKVVAEKKAINLSKEQCIIIVNPSTVYGPGDVSLNSGTLFKKIFSSKLIPIPSGISNVIDVDDVVEGTLAAALKGVSGERYILSGNNMSFNEIFKTVANIVNKNPIFISLLPICRYPLSFLIGLVGKLSSSKIMTPQIVSDMFNYRNLSNAKAKEILEWKPNFTFRETAKRAWTYYKENNLI